MIRPLSLIVLIAAGLAIGIGGSLFDPARMVFMPLTREHVEAFPYYAFVPGLAVGLGLGAFSTMRWGEFGKRLRVWLRSFGAGVDILVVALACVCVLVYI